MVYWWYCPKCGKATDEFEAVNTKLCYKCSAKMKERAEKFWLAWVKQLDTRKMITNALLSPRIHIARKKQMANNNTRTL